MLKFEKPDYKVKEYIDDFLKNLTKISNYLRFEENFTVFLICNNVNIVHNFCKATYRGHLERSNALALRSRNPQGERSCSDLAAV